MILNFHCKPLLVPNLSVCLLHPFISVWPLYVGYKGLVTWLAALEFVNSLPDRTVVKIPTLISEFSLHRGECLRDARSLREEMFTRLTLSETVYRVCHGSSEAWELKWLGQWQWGLAVLASREAEWSRQRLGVFCGPQTPAPSNPGLSAKASSWNPRVYSLCLCKTTSPPIRDQVSKHHSLWRTFHIQTTNTSSKRRGPGPPVAVCCYKIKHVGIVDSVGDISNWWLQIPW